MVFTTVVFLIFAVKTSAIEEINTRKFIHTIVVSQQSHIFILKWRPLNIAVWRIIRQLYSESRGVKHVTITIHQLQNSLRLLYPEHMCINYW